MTYIAKRTAYNKLLISALTAILAVIAVFAFGEIHAQAKTYKITTPEQLVDINWKYKGYGPGNKYVIANDMTLGDGEYSTCRLTKGKFIIDFNGHTVQNATKNLGTFSISGANVVFIDSKASNNKPSVRSYGAGAIDMTAGRLEIRNGNYVGLTTGETNPCGLHVGGGTCIVNGGFIGGDYMGADCSGGTLMINGGTFEGGYLFALSGFGDAGKIRISKGRFIGGSANNKYQFPLGAVFISDYYDFNKWLASGSSYSSQYETCYWNLQTQFDYAPSMMCPNAVMFGPQVMNVKSTVKAPSSTVIKKVSAKKKALKISWKKNTKNVSGYQIQLSTVKNFKKNVKTVTVTSNKTVTKTVKKLKGKKEYYVRIRTYRNFNGTVLYSKWSKAKSKLTK
ncbi:MAG: fibronectin type III domain-containing protein [Eubacterium sp.]|nr:fibronectin type III domain-containing protein [Eubacterium sp.]